MVRKNMQNSELTHQEVLVEIFRLKQVLKLCFFNSTRKNLYLHRYVDELQDIGVSLLSLFVSLYRANVFSVF